MKADEGVRFSWSAIVQSTRAKRGSVVLCTPLGEEREIDSKCTE